MLEKGNGSKLKFRKMSLNIKALQYNRDSFTAVFLFFCLSSITKGVCAVNGLPHLLIPIARGSNTDDRSWNVQLPAQLVSMIGV